MFNIIVTNFINPAIEDMLWILFLERIVKNYIQCFFNSSSKLKQRGLDGTVKVIKEHCQILEEVFKD